MYIPRMLQEEVQASLLKNPVTAVLGPRQCGKSTLVKQMIAPLDDVLYLDLERPSDIQKMEDPEWFLSSQDDKLICLDEIQRLPEIFPLIRSLVDEHRMPGRFLILGSASRELIKQSSESLAGRISYKTLTPFLWSELSGIISLETYISRGGFPLSTLSNSDSDSYEWRLDFISTFLERDLLQFAGFTAVTMRRLWQMLAHNNGQTLNLSRLGESLGVSHTTIRNYVDLLEHTFMVKQLPPWNGNTKKRLVKSPKVYLTDSGITAALLQLNGFEQVAGHPVFGSLWESVVFMQLNAHIPHAEFSFYRTNHGHELDFILSFPDSIIAIECKASVAPSVSKGTYKALEDVNPDHTFVVAPVDKGYSMTKGIEVVSLSELVEKLTDLMP